MHEFEMFPVELIHCAETSRLHEEISRLRMQLAGAWIDIAKLKLECAANDRHCADWMMKVGELEEQLKLLKEANHSSKRS